MKRLILSLALVFLLFGSKEVDAVFDKYETNSAQNYFKVTKVLDSAVLETSTKLSKIINDVADGARGTKTTVSLANRFAHLARSWLPEGTLKHIFEGVVDSNGFAGGFHHAPSANGAKILKIETPPNAFGVYSATVEINGVTKNGISTFFPDHWSREKVVEAIDYVRKNGSIDPKDNRAISGPFEGVEIKVVYTDTVNKIIKTAYPVL